MEAARLKQPIYLKNVLTLKWKTKDVLFWGRDYTFVSTENKKLWIRAGLKKFKFN